MNVNSTSSLAYIGYWRRLWLSDDFVGQTSEKCVGVIHADIVGTWNLPDKDKVCLSLFVAVRSAYLGKSVPFKHSVQG